MTVNSESKSRLFEQEHEIKTRTQYKADDRWALWSAMRETDLEALRTSSVLLVEAEAGEAQVVAGILKEEGARVLSCTATTVSWDQLKGIRFDLVIWSLPKIDAIALEAVTSFREKFSFQEVGLLPLIALTPPPESSDLRRIFEHGFQAFLPRPIDRPYLLEVVSGLVSLHRSWIEEKPIMAEMDLP